MDQQLLTDIVEQAARAPSIHNTQPWRFVARHNLIELWTDPSRGLDVLDPTGRARHLSCGAALLHARVAAAAAGYVAVVTLQPDPAESEHLADLRLEDGAGGHEEDRRIAEAISTRRTARAPFTDDTLSDDVLTALRHAAEAEACWLRIVDSTDDAAAVAVLLARADELETADPAYREELRRWTEHGDDARDGVPDSAVPDVPPGKRGSNFRLRDFVADRGEATVSPESDEPPPVERPVVAVLGTRDDDIASWLAAGQGLGRLLLTASSLGVLASPMTQPLEIPDTRARLSAELGLLGHPQMLLRLGYGSDEGARKDVAVTPRRPVEDILTMTEE